jgi:integrase
VPELDTTVFILPEWLTKNGEERIVVLNTTARRVIEEARGHHPERVFTYGGRPVTRMYNTAWKKARARMRLKRVRVHDLRHTFGQRLRAAGVPLEDRKTLLGHKCGDVTTHYSAPELAKSSSTWSGCAWSDRTRSCASQAPRKSPAECEALLRVL